MCAWCTKARELSGGQIQFCKPCWKRRYVNLKG
jgi:hypothetical protein